MELFSVVYGKDRHQLKLSRFYSKRCPSVERYMAESDDDLEITKDDDEIKKALFITTFERLWVQRNSFTLYSKTAQHTANFLTSAERVLGVTLLIMQVQATEPAES